MKDTRYVSEMSSNTNILGHPKTAHADENYGQDYMQGGGRLPQMYSNQSEIDFKLRYEGKKIKVAMAPL